MPLAKNIFGATVLAAALAVSGQASAAGDPTGVWLNDTGRGAIEIKDCDGKLCGHVVWVKDTTDTKGCGRQIIGDIADQGDGTWSEGWVYNPDKKKRYDVEVTPLKDGTLKVMGYAGTKFFSRTMIWTKAPADLERCGETTEAAAPVTSAEDEVAAVAPEKATKKVKKVVPVEEEEVASEESSEEGGVGDKLGSFLQKGKDGKCKLDLPWVKLDFQCEGNKDR